MRCCARRLSLLAGCGPATTSRRSATTLALDFQPNPVHAGHLRRRGRGDSRCGCRPSSTDSLKLLATGRADMAVVDIHDLGLARERGEDLVGVGALVQRPLAAVIARPGVGGRATSRAGASG